MKNTFGNSLTATLFGESHGSAVGIVLDGLPAGLPVCETRIAAELTRRRPASALDTARKEADRFQILSGVFRGKTTGTPLCIVIPNENTRSDDYLYGPARPSHADYAAYCKYRGFEDYRGGGHFSGRITAALVAAGGILLPALETHGIRTASHILRCGGVSDRPFTSLPEDFALLRERHLPVLDAKKGEEMSAAITHAAAQGDSVGGVVQTAVYGLPAGLGEPWFDSVEGVLSHALFSLGGVKGVEFGDGFALADLTGSTANDAFRMENERIVTASNHSGGISGGITNAMPLLFQCAVKPTASIAREQQTVDFLKNEETVLAVRGRHDPAIVRRICPVIDSVTALVLCDFIAQRFGTDALGKEGERWNTV